MLVVFSRTIILYVIVVIVMRLMGKRQIGELQPFEFVITLLIAELASVPMENMSIPLINGIIPLFTLLFLQVLISFINLKSEKARNLICGTPSVVIEKGKIIEKELSQLQYSINDLLEQLRSKDCPNISDVEFAILETNGDLSVILKSNKRPITASDINVYTEYENLPLSLIIDGSINYNNLKKSNKSEEWLIAQLKKRKINNPKDVFYCSLESNNNLHIQKRNIKVGN